MAELFHLIAQDGTTFVRCAACIGLGHRHGAPLAICTSCIGHGWMTVRPPHEAPRSAYEMAVAESGDSR